jgi:hypothetical protein
MGLPLPSRSSEAMERPGSPLPVSPSSDPGAGAAVETLMGALISGALGVAAIAEGGAATTGAVSLAVGFGVVGGALALSGAVALGTVAAVALVSPTVRTQLGQISAVIGWSTSPVGLGAFVGSALSGASSSTAIAAAEFGAAAESAWSLSSTLRGGIKGPTDIISVPKDAQDVTDYLRDRMDGWDGDWSFPDDVGAEPADDSGSIESPGMGDMPSPDDGSFDSDDDFGNGGDWDDGSSDDGGWDGGDVDVGPLP